MTNACRACNKSITFNGLTCANCSQSFHGKCVFRAGIKEQEVSKEWKCGRCSKKIHNLAIARAQISNPQVREPKGPSTEPNGITKKITAHSGASEKVSSVGVQPSKPKAHDQVPNGLTKSRNVREEESNLRIQPSVPKAFNQVEPNPNSRARETSIHHQEFNIHLPNRNAKELSDADQNGFAKTRAHVHTHDQTLKPNYSDKVTNELADDPNAKEKEAIIQTPKVCVQPPKPRGPQVLKNRGKPPHVHVKVHKPDLHGSNARVHLPSPIPIEGTEKREVEKIPDSNDQVSESRTIKNATLKINDVYGMFLELKADLKTFRTGIIDSIKRLHAKIENNTKMFANQNEKIAECFGIIQSLRKENEDLRNDIENIKQRQTEADQKTRQNDLEIRGIPLQPNENVVGVLQSLAVALRSPLLIDGHSIVFCYRARPKDDAPGTIHVRFSHRLYKDDILRRRCAYRGFNSRLMSLPVTSLTSVFVNESLCPERRVLFRRANELRREKNYKYIWTREGRILLRKSDYCPVTVVNCLADLNQL